jgi:hypothetical protein
MCKVPRAGLEPAQLYSRQILSLMCLPLPPPRRMIAVCPVLHLNLLPLVYHASDQLYTFVDHILRQPAPGRAHKSAVRCQMIQAK